MREISVTTISERIEEMCIGVNHALSDDMITALDRAAEEEETVLGKRILGQLQDNLKIAGEDMIPICQDTGMAVVFLEIGQDVHLTGGAIEDAVNAGVRAGYTRGYLRKSVVADPYERVNTGDNTPAVIHYAVAKIFGPLIFGRGWCGYACWTAMVLDFLPYKVPSGPRKKLGWIRYLTFAASLIFVSALFLARVQNIERIMFWAFIIGNALYYALGAALAFIFKDNRAFCKYLCPVTVFLKPMSYFSLFRIKCDKERCVSCGKCKRVCPMDVDVTDNSRRRRNGTECILCMECVKNCPKDAL